MLRRGRKFNNEDKSFRNKDVLGSQPTRKRGYSADPSLETEVFGGQNGIVEKLDEFVSSKRKHHKTAEDDSNDDTDDEVKEVKVLKPVWTDDDPTVDIQSSSKVPKTVTKWARLPCQQPDFKSEGDSDSDAETQVDAVTRRCLASTSTLSNLPKTFLKTKKGYTNSQSICEGKKPVSSVEYNPTAQMLLKSATDGSLRLFQVDCKKNPLIQQLYVSRFPISTAHFTCDGHQIIMGSKYLTFYYYDMMAGKVINVPRVKAFDGAPMSDFVMSPDGNYIAFLGKYGNIHLLSAHSKEWIGSMKMNDAVKAVAFNNDGTQMFSHGAGDEVYVWDVRQRLCCHKFIDDGCGVSGTSLAISPGNQYIATGSDTGFVNIYDMTTCLKSRQPKPLKAFKNLTTSCTLAKFNSTAEILAIGSGEDEQSLRMIHVQDLSVFSNFPTSEDKIGLPSCLDFSCHSGYFAVGNKSGCVLQYRLTHYGNY